MRMAAVRQKGVEAATVALRQERSLLDVRDDEAARTGPPPRDLAENSELIPLPTPIFAT